MSVRFAQSPEPPEPRFAETPRPAYRTGRPVPPPLIWRASPNFGYPPGTPGRAGEQITAIVDHIAQGTKAGLDATFARSGSQVSAHFGVMRDSSVHQYVLEEDAAWGAGILNAPDESLPWLPPPGPGQGSRVNQRVISIEHEGYSGEPLTPAQSEATVALHRYLAARWGIPADRDHIVGHSRLDSVNRRNCPGPAFPWKELFNALRQGDSPVDKDRTKRALDIVWGWSEKLEQLTAAQAAKELKEAVTAIKEEVGLQ